MTDSLTFRQAGPADTDAIVHFVDYWMSGGAKHDLAPGGGQDYFVPRARHQGYLKKHHVLLALDGNHIVGWAVTTEKNSLIHLLVAGDARQQGIGQRMLQMLNPDIVRSKTDQESGDPTEFYLKRGYEPAEVPLQGKNENIKILLKTGAKVTYEPKPKKTPEPDRPAAQIPDPEPKTTIQRLLQTLQAPKNAKPGQESLDYSKD